MSIKVLPDQVINQISAGEVVERPFSVVRELVDNAVDAGAGDITIYIEAGGKSLIKVCDDGIGMPRDDALLAFERHATSKLTVAEDLLEINTFGFRGEALPSIASVSRVTMRTKTEMAEIGTEVKIEAGAVKSVRQVPCNKGTEIEVFSLFYNTPARRNFLKTNKTEELKIKQWVINFCLVHPSIRFRLFIDGKESINFPRRQSILERSESIIKGSTVEVDFKNDNFRIIGIVAHPAQAVSDSGSFMLYINKRLISDRMILRAVKEGFDSMLKEREFPVGFLAIEMPHETVDVNVHPQKSEVRFRKPQDVFLSVRSAVLNSVKTFKTPAQPEKFANIPVSFSSGSFSSGSAALKAQPAFFHSQYSPLEMLTNQEAVREPFSFKYADLNFIGQIFSCYLLCTLEEKLFVIDMHAAHERCNYNTIRQRINTAALQSLLVPIIVEMPEMAINCCLEFNEVLTEYGFDVEAFTDTSLAVRKIPGILDQKHVPDLMRHIASSEISGAAAGRIREKVDHIVARLACHASIRSGYRMKREEVYALFEAMDVAETGAACPHGRPVAVQFSEHEIEKWFGRDR
jgi:DNA mismatch repair protein MutL